MPFSTFSSPGNDCRFQFFLHRAGFAVFSFFFAGQGLPFSAFSSPGRVCRFQLFLYRAELLRFFTTTLPSSIYDWVCTFAAFLRLLFFHVALRSFSRRRPRRLFFFRFSPVPQKFFPLRAVRPFADAARPSLFQGGDLPYSSVRFCIATPSRKICRHLLHTAPLLTKAVRSPLYFEEGIRLAIFISVLSTVPVDFPRSSCPYHLSFFP